MPTDLCRYCGTTYDIVQGHTCQPLIATTSTGGEALAGQLPTQPERSSSTAGHVTGPAVASPPATAGPTHGERRVEPAPTVLAAGPAHHPADQTAGPTLDQAIQAAAKELLEWSGNPAPACAEAAPGRGGGVLTRPLEDAHNRIHLLKIEIRDLQHRLSVTDMPPAWGHEAAAELDRLAAFEAAIRDALKPWKSSRDIIDEVATAVVTLDRRRGQLEDRQP